MKVRDNAELPPSSSSSLEMPSIKTFTTISGVPTKVVYTAADIQDLSPARDFPEPGQFPYTRGIHETLYRGRLWTMRQFAGFGTPEDTNQRFKYLLGIGQTGLSVAFDLPTLMGLDSDDPLSGGEVGKCGVSISSLADMEALFDGIPIDQVTTSMTINAPAAMIFAMYLAVAEKQGVDWQKISGTVQNDILKEYIAQKEWIYPPRPSMRLIVDSIVYCTRHLPRWNSISISGYHIREAGSTALQELAFTLRDGLEYVEACLAAGLKVDEFAPRLSFFFNAHSDFFEEIAKYRAARKVWAKSMQERFQAKSERSLKLRFHSQTAGCSLTGQQPYNNVVRTALQALAAVLGGTQSLHTNSLDETLALPSEQAATIALRTQQIIAYESGVINTADPLGGSYFLEALTRDMEKGAYDYFDKIDNLGGMVAAIECGYPQKELQEASYRYQKELEGREKFMVGINAFVMPCEPPIEILYIDRSVEEKQIARLKELRQRRRQTDVDRALSALKRAAAGTANLMPFLLDSVRAYATLGEMCNALKDPFGVYKEPPI
ncbi:MAG: methylmalonyl-CoA mutase family protein [Acidobacteria bacterium]|nr:methylmalonyl-CoA mutase family protein [Acidobacteriota bacterium]